MRTPQSRISTAALVGMVFGLAACGGGGGSSAPPPGPPAPPPPPPAATAPTRLTLSSDYIVVAPGQSASLSWDSDAAGCTASAGWSGAKSASGQVQVGPLIATTAFDLSCATAGFNPLTATVTLVVANTLPAGLPTSKVTSVAGITSLDFQRLSVGIRDIVWDPQSSRFYAVTRADSSLAPNSLLSIDPLTRATRATPLGAEPWCVAVSADGTYLYAGFKTGGSIRRFLANGLTQDLSIRVGATTSLVAQIAVSPAAARTIAARVSQLGSQTENFGVVILDDAVARAGTLHGAISYSPSVSFANLNLMDIDWSTDATRIQAALWPTVGEPRGLLQLAVNAQGVTIDNLRALPLRAPGALQGDQYFAADGAVFSLNGPVEQLGVMADWNQPRQHHVTSLARGKTFNASGHLIVGTPFDGSTLESFDPERFTLIDSIIFSGVAKVANAYPVLWGTDGVALVAQDELVVAHGSFMEAGGIPPPPPIPAPTGAAISTSLGTITYRIFDVGATAIAANPCGHAYVGTASTAAPRPNAVLDIELATLSVSRSMHGGSDPQVLAASDDCAQLYVARRFSNSVAKVRLSDLSVTNTLSLGGEVTSAGSLSRARSMSVAPSLPDTVAIAKAELEYSLCGGNDHSVDIFDGNARRPAPWSSGGPYGIKSVAWSSNANTLYGEDSAVVYSFGVNAGGAHDPLVLMSSGPSIPGVDAFDLGRDLHYDGVHNRVYNSVGMFFDVGANAQPSPIGPLPVPTIFATCGTRYQGVTTDRTSGKLFWVRESLGDLIVNMFAGANLSSAGSVTLPGVYSQLNFGIPIDAVRPSSDSLAVLTTSGDVLLMQGPGLGP